MANFSSSVDILQDLTVQGGCVTFTNAATDIDLIDNNASALSFDSSGQTGILEIVTTDCSEGVTMSGTLGVTGILTANAGVVVDNFTLDGTELDLSTGDFALDVAGDIEVNADGGCINFKDASLALAAIVNTSCVGELRIHEAANYIGLKPPALSANQTWTWPAAVASCACDVLTCNGSGVLSWATAAGGPSEGTEANIEEEITGEYYAPLDLLKHSPGVAKFWVKWESSGAHSIATNGSYNMTSVTDGGAAGDTDHLWATDFSQVEYVLVGMAINGPSGVNNATVPGAGGVTTLTFTTTTGIGVDRPESYLVGFGPQ